MCKGFKCRRHLFIKNKLLIENLVWHITLSGIINRAYGAYTMTVTTILEPYCSDLYIKRVVTSPRSLQKQHLQCPFTPNQQGVKYPQVKGLFNTMFIFHT